MSPYHFHFAAIFAAPCPVLIVAPRYAIEYTDISNN